MVGSAVAEGARIAKLPLGKWRAALNLLPADMRGEVEAYLKTRAKAKLAEEAQTLSKSMCAECMHFAPDSINPLGGLGQCGLKESNGYHYPGALHYCRDYKAKDVDA